MSPHTKCQLTPAARNELKKALDEYREAIIRNAMKMHGKSSFNQEDIRLCRSKMAISAMLLPDDYQLAVPHDITKFTAFSVLMVLKLALIIMSMYFVVPDMNRIPVATVISIAAVMFFISCYLAYRLYNSRKNIKRREMAAGTLVWQWSAIESLSSRHIEETESAPRLVAIFDYLDNEFKSTHKIKQLKEILRARNNIVNHQHIELRNAQRLIDEADDIIRHLRTKADNDNARTA